MQEGVWELGICELLIVKRQRIIEKEKGVIL